jgi:preprotein translocase subunit SecE
MDNYSKIYWLTRLDALQTVFIIIPFLLGVGFMFVSIYNSVEYDKSPKKKSVWVVGIIISFFSIIACLIPSKNDMILIWAGGKTMDYVQSDTSLSKIPYQTTSIITEYLDKSIQELKDKK